MGKDISSGLREKLSVFYDQLFSKIITDSDITSYDQLISLWTEFNKINSSVSGSILLKYTENLFSEDKTATVEKIEADYVTIEIVDRDTGKLFRRDLPLDYIETDNGIVLSGENSEGIPTDITFLSGTALKKISDLTGKGPDKPRCNH